MNPIAAPQPIVRVPEIAVPDIPLEGRPKVPAGPIMFARYAYPPNELGYCGPRDSQALFQYGAAGVVDPGLGQLARAFAGAWPYLELIAAATRISEPLDRRVVEAYWLGNDLLANVDMQLFGNSLLERFRKRAGTGWGHLAEAIPVGAVPNHSFHVFGIYPWVGLLGADRGDTPLHVLDRCRIRWGQIVSVQGDQATVLSRPLTWDGHRVGLGDARPEQVTCAVDGTSLVPAFRAGEWVSLHWGWICDRLSRRQISNLRRFTLRQFEITNQRVAHSGAAEHLA